MSDIPGAAAPGAQAPEGGRRSSRRRRRLRWLLPLLVLVFLAVAAGVYLAIENSRAVSLADVLPESGALLNTQPVTVSCELTRFEPGTGTVSLTVDGQAVPPGRLVLQPGLVRATLALADGTHTASLTYDSSNLFSPHLARTWQFTVDTTPPEVAVRSPSSFPLLLASRSEVELVLTEPAVVVLTLDNTALTVDPAESADGSVIARLTAEDGEHALVAAVTDRAGNVTSASWDLVVDSKAPEVAAEGLPDEEVWNEKNFTEVFLAVADHFADKLQVKATLDGVEVALDESQTAAEGERVFSFRTGTLAEGTHDIEVTATDPAGHVTTLERGFLVDTSSTFGTCTMKQGAIGNDVKQLQRILAIKGTYDGPSDGDFGEATAIAVAAFNQRSGLNGGPVVTQETLQYLLGAIRIDLSERKLYLYGGDGNVVKTYRVAVGMPQYPTPTGNFRIITKEVDPTWDPPNSAWAKGMGPVPPGPGNPLGTRWMGLNSPGIGIHGTPTPSSIGTAASHGCIRMRIPEAEDLFARVFVGTPVEIVN